MENSLNQSFYVETSSDEYPSDTSDDDDYLKDYETVSRCTAGKEADSEECAKGNFCLKLINREMTGLFSGKFKRRCNQRAFNKVPSRLAVTLKDIVPYCYLQGHMFMGLSACGQFLFSYKVCFSETATVNDFNFGYKYTLFFWIYRPHQPLGKYFKICLFDDHGVDNLKDVTMTQWVSHPNVLVVHGAAENENEDSYITIINVPKLGCPECKHLREIDGDGFFRSRALCIKCNLTIHTKYSKTESDPKFRPKVNLVSPERIIIVANGFLHMLHVELDAQQHRQLPVQISPICHSSNVPQRHLSPSEVQGIARLQDDQHIAPPPDDVGSIVARIIQDFSDLENESNIAMEAEQGINFDELVFKCATSSGNSSRTQSVVANTSPNISIVNHNGKRNQRIVTKSNRSGLTTFDLQAGTSTSQAQADKSNAYEFSEDTEKCEKIGTFRKRRLADKKYEFSEDNSENIIPFTKIRQSSQLPKRVSINRLNRASSHFHSPAVSSSSSQLFETTSHYHRASPSQGFRSPCGSPIGSGIMRSPGKQQPQYQKSPPSILPLPQAKQLNSVTPLQVSVAKRNYYDIGNVSPTPPPFLSPRRERDECKVFEVPLTGLLQPEKPMCTKKFKRCYVEEDDAASVITSEEDDCISPGYHTSLPMEVHGSCYSDMQMISHSSYQKLKCATVIITQNSFDLETFTYYAISNLCQKNNKTYNVFYDWACEIINICPRSNTMTCMLLAHFSAREQLPKNSKNCLNCSRNIDCVFHRNRFECRILFSWNMETNEWDVLDYGELHEFEQNSGEDQVSSKSSKLFGGNGLSKIAKSLSGEISLALDALQDFSFNLRILESNRDRSKTSLIDLDNMVEFQLKRPRLTSYE